MSGCATFDPTGPYAGQVLALTDCHVQALAQGGWQALAGAGGALAGLLAIFVALIGYRLMLGRGPCVAEGAGLLARLALVLALVTQAPAYRALVGDVVLAGPGFLARQLATAADLGAVDSGAQAAQADALADRIAAVLATPDPVRPGLRMVPVATPGLPDAVKTPLHWAGCVLMVTVLAGWLSTRLVAGVLLGLGPVLAAGLLFAGTRGLALGWIRVLAGAALGQVVVALVLALALPLAQGQMAGLVAALSAGQAPTAMADALLTTALTFAAIMLAGLVGMARVGAGLVWPGGWRVAPVWASRGDPPLPAIAVAPHIAIPSDRRAERIVAATLAMDRREARQQAHLAAISPEERVAMIMPGPGAQARDGAGAQIIRLGQSVRRGAPRLSRQARQRDAQA